MAKYVNRNVNLPIASIEFSHSPGGTYTVLVGRENGSVDQLNELANKLPGNFRLVSSSSVGDTPVVVLRCRQKIDTALDSIRRSLPTLNLKFQPKKEKKGLDLMQIRGWLGNSGQIGVLYSGLDEYKLKGADKYQSRPKFAEVLAAFPNMLIPKKLLDKDFVKRFAEKNQPSKGSDKYKRKSALSSIAANVFTTVWGIEDAEDIVALNDAQRSIIDVVAPSEHESGIRERLDTIKDRGFEKKTLERAREKKNAILRNPLSGINNLVKENSVKISNFIKIYSRYQNILSGAGGKKNEKIKTKSTANMMFGALSMAGKFATLLSIKKKRYVSKRQKYEKAIIDELHKRSAVYRGASLIRKARENGTRIAGVLEWIAMAFNTFGCFPRFNPSLRKIDVGQLWYCVNLLFGFGIKAIAPTKVEKIDENKLYKFAQTALATVPESERMDRFVDVAASIHHHLGGEVLLSDVLVELEKRLPGKKKKKAGQKHSDDRGGRITTATTTTTSHRKLLEQQGHGETTASSLADKVADRSAALAADTQPSLVPA